MAGRVRVVPNPLWGIVGVESEAGAGERRVHTTAHPLNILGRAWGGGAWRGRPRRLGPPRT